MVKDSREPLSQSYSLSRRDIVKAVGAAGIAGLAGCSQASNGSNSGGSTLTMFMDEVIPNEINFNPWNGGTDDMHRYQIFEYIAGYHQQKGEWYPVALNDWEIPSTIKKGETVQCEIFKNFTWHDGTDYKAKDFAGNLRLWKHFEDPLWDFISDVKITGDKTVEIPLSQKVDPLLLEETLFGGKRLMYRDDIFKENLDKLESANNDSQRKQAMNELTQYRYSGRDLVDEGLGCGPFKYSDSNSTRLILEPYEDYENPYIKSDDIGPSQISMLPIDTPEERWQSMMNEEADVAQNSSITNAQVEQLDKNGNDWMDWIVQLRHTGRAVVWNTRRKPLDNRKVRWALAHAIDRQTMLKGESYGSFMLETADIPCGMSNFLTDKWIGDRKSKYMKFSSEGKNVQERVNREKATNLLKAEGFSKEGQWWQTPDNNRFEIELKSPPYFAGRSQALQQVLEDFGVKVKIYNEESTTYEGQTVPNHEYDALHWWQGQVPPIPYNGYNTNMALEAHLTAWPKNWDDDSDNNEYKIDVPPIGKPEGKLKEVDVKQILSNLSKANSESKKKSSIQKLAWIYNWNQDKTYDVVRNQAVPFTTDDWKWPSPSGDRGLEKDQYGVDQNAYMRIGRQQSWPIRFGFPKPK